MFRVRSALVTAMVSALAAGAVVANATPAPLGPQVAPVPADPALVTMAERSWDLHPADRYAPAGGCYGVVSAAGGVLDGPLRFQATDLGRYLLQRPDGSLLATAGSGLTTVDAPAAIAEWELYERGDGTFELGPVGSARRLQVESTGAPSLVEPKVSSRSRSFALTLTDGCASFPEAELNVTGPVHAGTTPYQSVLGYLDAHLHITAFEFLGGLAHCGAPWHAYGVTAALADCPDHALTAGHGAVLENLLSGGLLDGHDPGGWPTFTGWPAPASLTHEQTYYRWMERSWRAGQRMIVNLLVENRVLCEVYPLKKNDCDEMASVRLQATRIRELERYIDAQWGGPGKGWFRIVETPEDARRVINEGRLAVVLGVEISEPFGCRTSFGVPQCSAADIDRELDELVELGVRQLVVIHKFDNALGGVTGDGGSKGLIINLGNLLGTGSFWEFEQCHGDLPTGSADNTQDMFPLVGRVEHPLFDALLQVFGGSLGGLAPLYAEGPHCSPIGLSDLGRHSIEAMIERDLIVDIDHMSVRARLDALDVLEAHGHSGVISSHSWASEDAYPRVQALGGVISPYAGQSSGFVREWDKRRATADPRYLFGIGFGADSNGLGAQGTARKGAEQNPVVYPFAGLGGTVVDQQITGVRVYDINRDGVAHYGLYPDWIEDLRVQVGDQIVADLAQGSEAYLQMWERAGGIGPPRCVDPEVLGRLRPGMSVRRVLETVGQPVARVDRTFTYCVGEPGRTQDVVFDPDGRLIDR